MNLVKRLERLEEHVRAQNRSTEPLVCRRLIYDPRDWDIDEEAAIAQMQAEELEHDRGDEVTKRQPPTGEHQP